MKPNMLVTAVLLTTSLVSFSATSFAGPDKLKVLDVLTEANFKALCSNSSSNNTNKEIDRMKLVDLFMDAAQFQYFEIIDNRVEFQNRGWIGFTAASPAKNLDERAGYFMPAIRESLMASQKKTDESREIEKLRNWEVIEKLFREKSSAKNAAEKIEQIELSFLHWALMEGVNETFPYRLSIKNLNNKTIPEYLMTTRIDQILDQVFKKNGDITIGCHQTIMDTAGLSPKFKIRKNSDNLLKGVTSSGVEGAEVSFSTKKSVTDSGQDKEVISWGVNATIGFNPFENEELYIYTSFEYEDEDTKLDGVDSDLEANNSDFGDPDQRKYLKFGVIGDLGFINPPVGKIITDIYSIQDLKFNSEIYTSKIAWQFSNLKEDSFIGEGKYLLDNLKLSVQPQVWTQYTYVADLGENKRFAGLQNIADPTDNDGDYLGLGIGGQTSLSYKSVTLSANYDRMFTPSGKLDNIYLLELSAKLKFPNTRNFGIKFAYEKGYQLDTLNPIDDLSLKFTFTY